MPRLGARLFLAEQQPHVSIHNHLERSCKTLHCLHLHQSKHPQLLESHRRERFGHRPSDQEDGQPTLHHVHDTADTLESMPTILHQFPYHLCCHFHLIEKHATYHRWPAKGQSEDTRFVLIHQEKFCRSGPACRGRHHLSQQPELHTVHLQASMYLAACLFQEILLLKVHEQNPQEPEGHPNLHHNLHPSHRWGQLNKSRMYSKSDQVLYCSRRRPLQNQRQNPVSYP